MRLETLCPILLAAAAPSALGQTLLWEGYGTELIGKAGFSVAGGADFDQDGFDDVVVGAPFKSAGGMINNGVVRVISGADGSILHTKVGDSDFDYFGWSVAVTDDIDADGSLDFVVGAPNALQGAARPGLARLVSGRTSATMHTVYGVDDDDALGLAVVGRIDWNQDGVGDFIAGAPAGEDPFGSVVEPGYIKVVSGVSGAVLGTYSSGQAGGRYGSALATGDIDGDGDNDLVIGSPDGGASGQGKVLAVGSVTHLQIWQQTGGAPGHEFGSALTVGDSNGDGFEDVFVGAPGDDLATASAGSVRAIDGLTGTTFHTWYGTVALERFGAALAVIGDVDEDGDPDLVVGAPAESTGGVGAAVVISTGTLAELFRVEGQPDALFGAAVARAGDFNDDGSRDFVVGAPHTDNPETSTSLAGVARVFSGACPGYVKYCTAGTSASGCQAEIQVTGVPSATAQMGFFVGATSVEGNKNGIFFYGANGRQANAWGNGTSFQCVVPPVQRGGLIAGSGTGGICNGSFLQDLNARWCASCPKPNHNPGAGAVVQAQLWYRDPQNSSNQTTSLSNAVEFVMCP